MLAGIASIKAAPQGLMEEGLKIVSPKGGWILRWNPPTCGRTRHLCWVFTDRLSASEKKQSPRFASMRTEITASRCHWPRMFWMC